MQPGETARLECGECLLTFSLSLAPPAEWVEPQESVGGWHIEATCCPFCGSGELKAVNGSTSTQG